MRIMAVDFGLRRIGVAVSDPGGRLARPLATLAAGPGRDPVRALEDLARGQLPGVIVVGDPRRLDGSPGSHSAAAAGFADLVRKRLGLPVVMWDERLTTVEAGEKLREAGAGRKKRRALMDAAAAAVILQDYLDAGSPRDAVAGEGR
jgi:putative Holliday junction resolvase